MLQKRTHPPQVVMTGHHQHRMMISRNQNLIAMDQASHLSLRQNAPSMLRSAPLQNQSLMTKGQTLPLSLRRSGPSIPLSVPLQSQRPPKMTQSYPCMHPKRTFRNAMIA